MTLQRLKDCIDKHEVISFDIFDTLLVRPYAHPSDLFTHIEKLFNIPGFCSARIAAEANARAHSTKEEITLDAIYKELPNCFKDYLEKEIELELSFLRDNPELKLAYQYAIEKNKKIIIISDMYLPLAIITKALDKNGYSHYHKLYLSSEILLTKHSGKLYEFIKKDLNSDVPQKILHIGDNYYADYERAIEKGINAFYYLKAIDKLLVNNKRAKLYYEENKNNLGVSIILGLLAYHDLKEKHNYWVDFGYKYAGPVVFSYMFWLLKQLKQDKITDALFVARDGFSLKKVFDLINNNKKIQTSYIYAPRVLSTLFYLDYNEKQYIDQNEKLSAIKAILEHYKDKDIFLQKETPSNPNLESGNLFIQNNISKYQQLAEKEKLSYKEYITAFASSDNVAIIDTCSINLSSQKLIENMIDKPLFGYYFLLQTHENANFQENKFILRSYREDGLWWIKDWDIMEFFMTSPEPPIKDFKNGKPIYKNLTKYEKIRSRIYPSISEGIVEFTQDILNSFKGYDVFIDWKDIFNWVNILCAVPTKLDKKMLSSIKHSYDFNHEKYIPICKEWYNFNYEFNDKTKIKLSLFNKEIIKKVSNSGNNRYYFCNIPIVKILKNKSNIKYYLFGKVPIYKKQKRNNSKKYFIFNIPIISFKFKQ